MGTKPKVIDINFKDRTHNTPGEAASPRYNNNGGGGDMNDKDFVTHKEFDNAMHNIDKYFDHIDTKFAEQTLGLYKAMVGVGLGVIAILGFLITLVTFLK
ncbi:hypothetical protein LMB39_11195 [Limosilactobacillus reuteri]|uniref:hypothetical protein n=1 Tax=Limosilactobacillus reuteri TaxID=1598 RepID=UPI001E2FA3BA|nr:hypothetical protein [Limosilactobacillus reuteri]MCC4347011.1 hypothetical protein [Limosilactobacillus reuteri]MCC4373930.1 hypothetical protein [Limosilactobacillus reuteri]MCC4386458.1 hypothetical protein [Limosilactobacillus reuteri]